MHFSATSTLLFLITRLISAAPAGGIPSPPSPETKDSPPPPGLDLTLYTLPSCTGAAHTYTSIDHHERISDSPGRQSYRLSRDLDPHDYLTFESSKPFVALGDARKQGCHDLTNGEAFWATFVRSEEVVE
ncbi:MAG: hypothetical protein LQ337_005995 [Flavoplaca oasis]|nr:MAG: hypothetical protein LQ337_005995 [Flavoplaca oasis]